jgi:hypothetical protein
MSVDAHACLRVVEAGQHAEFSPARRGDVTLPSPPAPAFGLTSPTGPVGILPRVKTTSKLRTTSLRLCVSAT